MTGARPVPLRQMLIDWHRWLFLWFLCTAVNHFTIFSPNSISCLLFSSFCSAACTYTFSSYSAHCVKQLGNFVFMQFCHRKNQCIISVTVIVLPSWLVAGAWCNKSICYCCYFTSKVAKEVSIVRYMLFWCKSTPLLLPHPHCNSLSSLAHRSHGQSPTSPPHFPS